MQKLQQSALVVVRRRRWRIAGVRALGDHDLVTLSGADAENRDATRRVLTPFDAIDPVEPPSSPVRVGIRQWRRACRALIADAAPPLALRAARHARVDLFPHQLAPALAVAAGAGARLLLADDVGLGKTVQASLVLAELAARHVVERTLVLTPAGLRDQWQDELRRRVGVDATIADIAEIGRRRSVLPAGVNPWLTIPTAIASMDFVKRPEVLPAVAACAWDLVIIDEAHNVAGASDRHAAAAALAGRALYVVLVTATPHNGDREAFRSLCALGAAGGDPPLFFRRTRRDVRVGPRRRVHVVRVRSTPHEARMHALVDRFLRAVARERGDRSHLAASTLRKRAFSSASSLGTSVARRLAALDALRDGTAQQLTLPIGDAFGELDGADDVPEWSGDLHLADPSRERRWLRAIADAAAAARRNESKIARVRALVRRIREPVLLFTEYRDTLNNVRAALACPSLVLHGGMGRSERRQALHAFANGEAAVLLATDAAGEGLNLQRTCRVVINFELPWNPMRLEQRIGRVDRIGQTRAVHAFHLVAGDTAEALIFDRLRRRVAVARRDAGAADPTGDLEECAVAHLVATGSEAPAEEPQDAETSAPVRTVDLELEAVCEAARLESARRRTREGDDRQRAGLESAAGWIACTRSAKTRARLGEHLLLVYGIGLEDGVGRIGASTIVSFVITRPEGSLREVAAALSGSEAIARLAGAAAAPWIRAAVEGHTAFMRALCARARAIADSQRSPREQQQIGLFDRRAVRAVDATILEERDAEDGWRARVAALDQASAVQASEPRLLLVLAPRP